MAPRHRRNPPKRRGASAQRSATGFTDEEKAAIRQRARELRAAVGGPPGTARTDGEAAVLSAIAAMAEPNRSIAERLHAIIRASAPTLSPRTWYGMPAYAKDGTVVLFFRSAEKFKERYMTLGFNDEARLDEGAMWPVSFALTALSAGDEARIAELVRRAVG